MNDRWTHIVNAHLEQLADRHQYRQRRIVRQIDATRVEVAGQILLNFSSNDYVGMSYHPAVRSAAIRTISNGSFGSGSAPLIGGYTSSHQSAEAAIAKWKGTESAILLPSGYQANAAAIQTAAVIGNLGGGVRFLVDKLAHASLIDAIRGSGEPFRVFPHNHMQKLARLLHDGDANVLQVVVTESIFSMDGDAADLATLAALKQAHGFLLLVDEAHATGVFGPHGTGLAHEMGLEEAVDVSVLTLSKAIGGIGGAVCASAAFCNALVNFARAYLFSTAIPPSTASAAEAAIGVLTTEPEHQVRVRQLARTVRATLASGGLNIPHGDSPIIPIILGSEEAAVEASQKLMQSGLFILPVRPPTVAPGTSRLRVTLSSAHSDRDIGRLIDELTK